MKCLGETDKTINISHRGTKQSRRTSGSTDPFKYV